MFKILDLAIGLTLIYFMLSVLCSGINEWRSQAVGRRGLFLRQGLLNILGTDRWIYLHVMNHPVVAAYYRDLPGKPVHPSYLPGDVVVIALMDVLSAKAQQLNSPALDDVNTQPLLARWRMAAKICASAGVPVATAVLPLLQQAGDDISGARVAIQQWYDGAMDRVSGWYKRDTQRNLFLLGLAFAILCNIDTLAMVHRLWTSATLRESLVANATATVQPNATGGPESGTVSPLSPASTVSAAAKNLNDYESLGLPIGFSCLTPVLDNPEASALLPTLSKCWESTKKIATAHWLVSILGWLLTALAIRMGSPFWFDLLGRLVDLRSTGRKPVRADVPPASFST